MGFTVSFSFKYHELLRVTKVCDSCSGIGGVLRNHEGKNLLFLLEKCWNGRCSNNTILAIKDVVQLFKSSIWSHSQCLIIECDSSNVVYWINSAHLFLVAFKDIIQSILKTGASFE
ncbi:hypothetical protein V6N13_142098 [Hibiscus sabdariffa]